MPSAIGGRGGGLGYGFSVASGRSSNRILVAVGSDPVGVDTYPGFPEYVLTVIEHGQFNSLVKLPGHQENILSPTGRTQ